MKRQVRKVVARNVRALMDSQGIRQGQFSERGGPSQKTISNVLNEESANSPTLDTLDAIARVLRVQAWQLLLPNLHEYLRFQQPLRHVVDNYLYATPEGKSHIQTVAEREHQYAIINERRVSDKPQSYSKDDCNCADGDVL